MQGGPKYSNGVGGAQQSTPGGLLFPGGFLPAVLPPLELQYPGLMERTEPPAIPQAVGPAAAAGDHFLGYLLNKQSCTQSQDESTSEVFVKFKATTIIKAAPNGALTLDSGGFKGVSDLNIHC